jgi:hypothetical protein
VRPCIPADLQRAAEEAEKRREAALARLLSKLRDLPEGDDFERQLHALMDADKRKDR